jgi:hypothetical protein
MKNVVLLKDMKDRLGRVYPKDRIVEQCVGKSFFGELGVGMGTAMNLERVSHTITNIRVEENDLICEIDFLKTPFGVISKTLFEEGVELKTSIRAVGYLNKENIVDDVIIFGFDFIDTKTSSDEAV